jgi:hypothetical protein
MLFFITCHFQVNNVCSKCYGYMIDIEFQMHAIERVSQTQNISFITWTLFKYLGLTNVILLYIIEVTNGLLQIIPVKISTTFSELILFNRHLNYLHNTKPRIYCLCILNKFPFNMIWLYCIFLHACLILQWSIRPKSE